MKKIIYIILNFFIIFNYKYIINEYFELKKDSFAFHANYDQISYWIFIRFKILNCNGFCNNYKIVKLGNKFIKNDFNEGKIYFLKFKLENNQECKFVLNTWDNEITNKLDCNITTNQNLWNIFIINDDKQIDLIIDSLILFNHNENFFDENIDFFNELPITFLLIDFYNNYPNSKYLYNQIESPYTWNYVGIIDKDNSYELLSNFDDTYNPTWFSINNVGSFEINKLLVYQFNNFLIKNFTICFNMEIIFYKQYKYDKINILNFGNGNEIYIDFEKINNYKLNLNFYFKNKKIVEIKLNIGWKNKIILYLNQFIINFKELINDEIKIKPILKNFDNKTNIQYNIKTENIYGNEIKFDKFDFEKIIIGGRENNLNKFYWIKIIYNEFQMVKGNFINKKDIYESLDFYNKNIYNFYENNLKLIRFENNISTNDCYYEYYIGKMYDCNKLKRIPHNFYNNVIKIVKNLNKEIIYENLEINQLTKIDLRIKYKTTRYIIIFINEINKYFELNVNRYYKYIYYTFFTKNSININIKKYFGNGFNSLNLELRYELDLNSSNFINKNITNHLNCSELDDPTNSKEYIIENYYREFKGKCFEKIDKENKYFNDYSKIFNNCYLDCKYCFEENKLLKCKSDNIIDFKYYIFNNYFLDFLIYNINIILFKSKNNQIINENINDSNFNEIENVYQSYIILNCTYGFNITSKNCFTNKNKFEFTNTKTCYLGYYKNQNDDCIYCGNNYLYYDILEKKDYFNFDICKTCNHHYHLNKYYYDYYKRKCIDSETSTTPGCISETLDKKLCWSLIKKNYFVNKLDDSMIHAKCIAKCNNCLSNYYLDWEKNCIQCKPNCKTCYKNKCFQCEDNYNKDPSDLNNNICTDGVESRQGNDITKCKIFFFLNSNRCELCIKNCEECENKNNCKKCILHYVYDYFENVCNLNKGCLDETCSECKLSYYKELGGTCKKCYDNCLDCDNGNTCNRCIDFHSPSFFSCMLNKGCSDKNCLSCEKNYSLMFQGTCTKCFDNCEFCINEKCIKCSNNYNNLFYKCILNENCEVNNKIQCNKCKLHYNICKNNSNQIDNCNGSNKIICSNCNKKYLNNGFCNILDSKILIYNNDKKIIFDCKFDYILFNNNCHHKKNYYEFDKIENLYKGCLNIYYEINYEKNKNICIKNDNRILNYYNGKNLNTLNSNYFVMIENSFKNIYLQKDRKNFDDNCLIGYENYICIKCKKSYLLNNEKFCLKIIALRCLSYENNKNCETCQKNYYLSNNFNCINYNLTNNCLEIKNNYCLKCKIGYYLNGNFCYKCNISWKYCSKCLNKNICTECNQNLNNIFYNQIDFKCKLCRFPCLKILNFKIIKCFSKYYLKNNECKLCNVSFCEECFENKCLKCKIGYYLKRDICFKCPNNCLECDKYNCFKAENNFYVINNKINKCKNNCIICSSNFYCLKCDEKKGYYLDFLTNSCIYKNFNCKKYNEFNNFCIECKKGYYKEINSYICKKCNENCKFCKFYENNCINCFDDFLFIEELTNNKFMGNCYKKCKNSEIFDYNKKICLNCGIYDWEIYKKYYLKLYFSKNLKINKKTYKIFLRNNMKINYLKNDKKIGFEDIKIKNDYLYFKLDLFYDERIWNIEIDIPKGLFNNTNCTENNYKKYIRAIDFEFIKKENNKFKITYLPKNSKLYKNINTYGWIIQKIAFIVSIILLITSLFFVELSNTLSKLFNTFQLISYFSILKINYSPFSNTIFLIVNFNFSIIFDIQNYLNISHKNQSIFSKDLYNQNIKVAIINQRFFSYIELNIILILLGFILRIIIKIIEKIYKKIAADFPFLIEYKVKYNKSKNHDFNNNLKPSRSIKIYKKKNIKYKKKKLNNFEKIKNYIKIFQLTMIMTESPNMFWFIFNYYKSFKYIDYKNIYHYIIIFNLITYNLLIFYFLKVTIKLTLKLKKYTLKQIYETKINYIANYFFIIGNYKKHSVCTYFWIFEFFRNFLISFNLIYMNHYLLFQIISVSILQIIYLVFIILFTKKDNFELKKLKIQEILVFYLIFLIFLIKYNDNSLNLDFYNDQFIGICISIFIFNIILVAYDLYLIFFKILYKIYWRFKNII